MRIGFSCPVLPGHLHPMLTLARKVQARGHEVFFLCFLDGQAMVEAAGVDLVPLCPETVPLGEMPRRIRELSQLSGDAALKYTLALSVDSCRAILAEGERTLVACRPDAMVLDTVGSGLNMVAMHMRLPFIHVSNAMHFDFSGNTPLCLFDSPHQEGLAGRVRNLYKLSRLMPALRPLIHAQREYAERVGLKINFKDPANTLSPLAQLTQTPREFDFPSDHWPAHFHYTGPFHDPALRPPVEFPWEQLTGEPLIYVSMGTLQNGSEQVFRAIAEGATAPGRQLVLSVGKHLDPSLLGPLAPDTIVVKHAPQLDLLERAAVCITHAGLNTVLESLAQGVPMVAIPIANDQHGVGARIAYTRTGLVVPLNKLTPNRIREALSRVLAEPVFRDNARRLQRAIKKSDGLSRAAEIIERTASDALLRSTASMSA